MTDRQWFTPLRRPALIIALSITLVACSTEAEPFFPTPRPTNTAAPSPTLLPATITPIPSSTDVPIATTATDANTFANTDNLPTAVLSYNSLNATPVPLNAPGGLDIEYFTTDAQAADIGGTLMLYWSIGGTDHGVIYRLTPTGGHDQFWQVGQTGTLEVTVSPKATDPARYELQISNAVSHLEKVVSVPIGSANCAQTGWVFTPAPSICPAAAATITPEAQQGFEHGQMLWIGLSGQIIVLFDDGKAPGWATYPDQFKDGQPDHDPSINAPAGKLQPVRGFGLVWRSQPGVRDRLGWALATEGQFNGFSQSDNHPAPKTGLYIATRDQQVAQLNADHTWKLIAATLASGATATPTSKR